MFSDQKVNPSTLFGVSIRVISTLRPPISSTVTWIALASIPCQCPLLLFCVLILHASSDAEPENFLYLFTEPLNRVNFPKRSNWSKNEIGNVQNRQSLGHQQEFPKHIFPKHL